MAQQSRRSVGERSSKTGLYKVQGANLAICIRVFPVGIKIEKMFSRHRVTY